eukprot:610691-Hanusia_phi.AAC.1
MHSNRRTIWNRCSKGASASFLFSPMPDVHLKVGGRESEPEETRQTDRRDAGATGGPRHQSLSSSIR